MKKFLKSLLILTLALSVGFAVPGDAAARRYVRIQKAVSSSGTITFIVGTGKGGDQTNVTSNAIDTTGANLIVVAVGDNNTAGAAGTLSDSKSNTWTQVRSDNNAIPRQIMWYSVNPTVGTGHTFTYTGGATYYPTIGVGAVSGANITPLDKQAAVTGTSPQTYASVTPSVNNEIIFVGGNGYNSNAPNDPTGYTKIYSQGLGSISVAFGLWYKIQTTAAAETPTMTFPAGGGGIASNLATFKP